MDQILVTLDRPHTESECPIEVVLRVHVARDEAQVPRVIRIARGSRPIVAARTHMDERATVVEATARSGEEHGRAIAAIGKGITLCPRAITG